jgi:hypothetical protein
VSTTCAGASRPARATGPAEDAGALDQVLHVHHVGVERVRELDVVAARAFTHLGLPFEVGTGFLSDPGRDHDEAAVVAPCRPLRPPLM